MTHVVCVSNKRTSNANQLEVSLYTGHSVHVYPNPFTRSSFWYFEGLVLGLGLCPTSAGVPAVLLVAPIVLSLITNQTLKFFEN